MNLRKILSEKGYDESEIKERMAYSPLFREDKGVEHWIESINELLGKEDRPTRLVTGPGYSKDRPAVVANHSGYGYKGSENFEHDDNGSLMNYSGVEDLMNDAAADHEGWELGYDYD